MTSQSPPPASAITITTPPRPVGSTHTAGDLVPGKLYRISTAIGPLYQEPLYSVAFGANGGERVGYLSRQNDFCVLKLKRPESEDYCRTISVLIATPSGLCGWFVIHARSSVFVLSTEYEEHMRSTHDDHLPQR